MDFGTLLHMAKKNNEISKDSNKFYSTKFAPPKKVSKEKRLSDNIQKFLQKREQEERERQREHRDKVAKLLAMRDEKSKNKIRKMLKVTKSANKSVLEDAINEEHTAITLQGTEQPDADDYGYTSTEANAFYQKYMEKVKNVKEDKGFAPSRPQSIKDLSSTKERVKAAITREIEEKGGPRQRSNNINGKELVPLNKNDGDIRVGSGNKSLYDPEAEKAEEERKKKEDLKKRQSRKPAPPPMDFQALLKLAEKKQYEPIEIPIQPKKKEPERLLTLKEKKELEDRKRAREERERKNREHADKSNLKNSKEQSAHKALPSNSVGRIPKLNQSSNNNNNNKVNTAAISASAPGAPTTTSSSSHTKLNRNENNNMHSNKLSKTNQNGVKKTSTPTVPTSTITPSSKTNTTETKLTTTAIANNQGKSHQLNGSSKVREFPPRDIVKTQHSKEPSSVRNNHALPSNNMKKLKHPNGSKKSQNNQLKRRILDDDDESEYDSEMDDFIDDGDAEEDYSSHIRAIFGYDKSKYCNIDEDDDAAMESSFAQVQREEFISKKIGIQEDLEDMKLEAMEKKRKNMLKKRRFQE